MSAPPRFPVPSADLVPAAPELRFRLSVAQREVDFLRKLLKVVESADADASPAILLFAPAPAGEAVARA